MKSTEFITDARRNPKLNKKLPRGEEVFNYLKNLDKNVLERTFINMSLINKIGVKPTMNVYGGTKEPQGIYTYSAKFYLEKKGRVEYARDRPYVHVITLKPSSFKIISGKEVHTRFKENKWTQPQIRIALLKEGYNVVKEPSGLLEEEYAILTTSIIENTKTFILTHSPFDWGEENQEDGNINIIRSRFLHNMYYFLNIEPDMKILSREEEYRLAVNDFKKYLQYINIVLTPKNLDTKLSSREIKNARRKYNAAATRYYIADYEDGEGFLADERSAENLLKYAQKINKKLSPEQEKIIFKFSPIKKKYEKFLYSLGYLDPKSAYEYAHDVIKGRWPKGEKAIASDPEWATEYARNVIGGRWPEAEKVIASDPRRAYYYARNVIKGRWPEVEKVIASDPKLAYAYANFVLKGRWPEGEKVIASDPKWAGKYAYFVLKRRWPEGEKAIASDPENAYFYARDILKDRDPKTWGERYLAGKTK